MVQYSVQFSVSLLFHLTHTESLFGLVKELKILLHDNGITTESGKSFTRLIIQ